MERDPYDLLSGIADYARRHRNGVQDAHVAATATLSELRRRFAAGDPLPTDGLAADEVIRELIQAAEGGLLASTGPRFFAWVIGGAGPAATAADWLTTTWDQNAALHACSPAAAVAEEVAGAWLKELLGLPEVSSFALTTGCQMAHMTCLAAARWRLLADRGWDPNERGLFGAPRLRVLVTSERHASIDRALRYLGIGSSSIEPLPVDSSGRLRGMQLKRALDPEVPCMLILDAGDLNIGACDPFAELIPLAHESGAWVHVDGAFGLFARASSRHGGLVQGIEGADSWATDAHKWLNVPFDSGVAIVRDREAHRQAMGVSASYIASAEGARDQIEWNPEWSRRARGFVLWAALKEQGRQGVRKIVDDCCSHCRRLVAELGDLPGVQVLWFPTLNQGLLRFVDPSPGASEADHDRRTDVVIEAVNASGELFVSGTTWRGRRAMRISVVNSRTSAEDIDRSVAAVHEVLRELAMTTSTPAPRG